MFRLFLPVAIGLTLLAGELRAQDAAAVRADLDRIRAALDAGALDGETMASLARHLRAAARLVDGGEAAPPRRAPTCTEAVATALRRTQPEAAAQREAISLCAPVRDVGCVTFAVEIFGRSQASATAVRSAAEACAEHRDVASARFVYEVLRRVHAESTALREALDLTRPLWNAEQAACLRSTYEVLSRTQTQASAIREAASSCEALGSNRRGPRRR